MPPTMDAEKDAPRARAASPFLVIGKPSRIVACAATVPGMPNRIAGIESDVVVTAAMPISIAIAGAGPRS